MTNLQLRSHILIEYLISKGYHKSTICWTRRCIRLALELGPKSEIRCYKDIFEAAVNKLQFKSSERRYISLKSAFGMVEDFDINGGFPNNRAKGFNKPEDLVEKLNPCFKAIALKHKETGYQGKNGLKQYSTIHTEYRAAVQFLLHFQRRGVKSLKDAKSSDIFSFFFDGDKTIRGRDYCNLIKAFLSHIEGEEKPYALKIIGLLPKIPKKGRLYIGLNKEEGEKVLLCLEDLDNGLSLKDRAVGLISYFYGFRGTDILHLTFDNFDWRNNEIVIVQNKTKVSLQPLSIEPIVGNAVFNYLKEIRMQQTDKTKVLFLKRNDEPYQSLVKSLLRIFKKAGVRQEKGSKGYRSMRHHFVTTLLGKGEKSEVVAKLVGHKDLSTLDKYADSDYNELKKCSLSISEFPINPEVFKI